jgi:hypothetical protein
MKAKPLKFCSGSRVGCEPIVRRAVDVVGWIVPSAALALLPKCPVCFAAYIALWTGIGLSISAAMYLRASLLVVSTALILFLVVRNARRLMHELGSARTRWLLVSPGKSMSYL